MSDISKPLSIDSDFSCSSLELAIKEFIEEYKFSPTNVKGCLEIVGDFHFFQDHELGKFFVKEIKDKQGLKSLYFHVDRDLDKWAWEVYGVKNNEIYKIYSPGA